MADHPQSRLAPHAQYGLAWSLFARGEASQAATEADALLKRKDLPADVAAKGSYVRALSRHRLKQHQPAIDDLQVYLKTKPTGVDRSDALYILGLCQEALDKNADAAATFTALLESDAKYAGTAKTLYELGWVYKALDKSTESTAAFARLAKEHAKDPWRPRRCSTWVRLLMPRKIGRPRSTPITMPANAPTPRSWPRKRHTNSAGPISTKRDLPRRRNGFLFQRKEYGNGPLAQDAAFMAGEAAFKQQKYKEALAEYAQVEKPQGADFALLALLHGGQAAAQLQDWKQARTLLESAVAQYPQTPYLPEINYELAWTLQNLDDEAAALKLYEAVTTQTDREIAARARFMIGEIYFNQKNHAEAVRHFFKAAYGYGYPSGKREPTSRPVAASKSSGS